MKKFMVKYFFFNEDHMLLPEYYVEADTGEDAVKKIENIVYSKYNKKYFEFAEFVRIGD